MALFPSQDQVGRPHPFALFTDCDVHAVGEEVGILPLLFLPFFQRASSHLALTAAATSPAQLREAVNALAAPATPEQAHARLVDGLDTATAGELWRGLFGQQPDATPDLHRAERMIATLLTICRDPHLGGLRIQPMAHQIHLCCLLMLWWLVRDRPGQPALIALLPGSASRMPSASVLAERPSPTVASATLWPEVHVPESQASQVAAALRGIHDLVAGPMLPTGTPLPAALLDPELPLRELLHGLTAVARKERQQRQRT